MATSTKQAMNHEDTTSYSRFACIGAGISAIGLGATLKRWYDIDDVRFFERQPEMGGTWWINQYPGCACDVPSALYSYSFAPNPSWSRVLPAADELRAYIQAVVSQYGLSNKMTLGTEVVRCEWIQERARWRLTLRRSSTSSSAKESSPGEDGQRRSPSNPIDEDAETDRTIFYHECQFLFSASGQLIYPRIPQIPGAETFRGSTFHSARWRHDVDLTDKRVVVFGNGCTAAQIVPSIAPKTKHLTQIIRSKHWIMAPVDKINTAALKWQLKHVPGAQAFQRLLVFVAAEVAYLGFSLSSLGRYMRARARRKAERYMRRAAPEKYHHLLIPDFEVGCKRRIFDSGYLPSLHADNVTLTDAEPVEIVPEGVRTRDGLVEADVIVYATGFNTNRFLQGIEVLGQGGKSLDEHWDAFGGPEAYNCCAMSGFPNFFLLLGPNTLTGHTSALIASENTINYSLRIIAPLLNPSPSSSSSSSSSPSTSTNTTGIANLNPQAEKSHSSAVQAANQNTVFSSGCRSWYFAPSTRDGSPWNAMMYPWSQAYFWYRCLFPTWDDWEFSVQGKTLTPRQKRYRQGAKTLALAALVAFVAGIVKRRPHSFHILNELVRILTQVIRYPVDAARKLASGHGS